MIYWLKLYINNSISKSHLFKLFYDFLKTYLKILFIYLIFLVNLNNINKLDIYITFML